jgi:hypothetical protein
MDDAVGDHRSPLLRPEGAFIFAERKVDRRETSIAKHDLIDTSVFLTEAWTSEADRAQDFDHPVSQRYKCQQVQQEEGTIAQRGRSLTSYRLPQLAHRHMRCKATETKQECGVSPNQGPRIAARQKEGSQEKQEQQQAKRHQNRPALSVVSEHARQRERQESHGKPPCLPFPSHQRPRNQQEQHSSHDQSIPFPGRATEIHQWFRHHQAIPGKLSHYRNDVG